MAAISFTYARGDQYHQAATGTSAPGAGMVEIRLADAAPKNEVLRLLDEARKYVIANIPQAVA